MSNIDHGNNLFRLETPLEQYVYTFAIKKNKMIKQGQSVFVGFSGGADSAALLHLLFLWQESLQIKLVAMHLNHRLRGEESDRDQEFAGHFCDERDIPFLTESIDVTQLQKQKKVSLEEAARMARYAFFNRCASSHIIATAHTLSDSIETTLFHLARGTGPQGLTGIPPARMNIIRPLLCVTRQQVEEFCSHYGLSYVTDSTNLEQEYTRNKIRHQVVPAFREINSGFAENIQRLQQLIAQDQEYLEQQATYEMQQIKNQQGYCVSEFCRLPLAISSRILRTLLRQSHQEVSSKRIDELYQAITDGVSVQLSIDCFLRCSQGYFLLENKKLALDWKQIIPIKTQEYPCCIQLSGGKTLHLRSIECKEIENIRKSCVNRLKNIINYDRITEPVILRKRRAGDAYKPVGDTHTRTLKNLLNRAKIPLWEREELLFLETQGQILWAESFGVAQWASVSDDTRHGLEIIIEKDKSE